MLCVQGNASLEITILRNTLPPTFKKKKTNPSPAQEVFGFTWVCDVRSCGNEARGYVIGSSTKSLALLRCVAVALRCGVGVVGVSVHGLVHVVFVCMELSMWRLCSWVCVCGVRVHGFVYVVFVALVFMGVCVVDATVVCVDGLMRPTTKPLPHRSRHHETYVRFQELITSHSEPL